ncbi:MAG: biopolymer transporter ExbD [Pseudomonadales bacterium]|nr:biopolymer transporter ExbD [Pseudomonadales bacterium]
MSDGSITGGGASLLAVQRKQARGGATRLNLVSLMDIFTILVFFLMLNTGEVEVLQPDEKVALPKSFAKLRPDNSPVIKVSSDAIYFKEQQVVSLDDPATRKATIAPLYLVLEEQLQSLKNSAGQGNKSLQSISIMGDASVDYSLLKKVLNTCAQAGYRDVALAVEYSTRAAIEQPLASNTGVRS